MIESQPELLIEPKRSVGPKLLAALAALLITALVFAGYALLRRRHAQNAASVAQLSQQKAEPRKPPKALIMVDDALLQGNKTIVGGTVKNTSNEPLSALAVELELKRRKDGSAEKQLIPLQPAQLEPNQEGRYSLELKAQEYGSARLVALRSGSDLAVPYTTAAGQKRPLERLETKTIIVGKSPSKGGEFLNSPDKPARVP